MKWVQRPEILEKRKKRMNRNRAATPKLGAKNQPALVDKSGIQKQKQQLDQRMRLHYKVAIEQIEQAQIDVT